MEVAEDHFLPASESNEAGYPSAPGYLALICVAMARRLASGDGDVVVRGGDEAARRRGRSGGAGCWRVHVVTAAMVAMVGGSAIRRRLNVVGGSGYVRPGYWATALDGGGR